MPYKPAIEGLDYYEGAAPGGAVTSVFGRGGAVVATTGDYTPEQTGAEPANANIQTHISNTNLDAHGSTSANPVTITGDGSDALTVNSGHIVAPYADTIRMAQIIANGGGTWKWGVVTNYLSWSGSLYLVAGRGAQATTSGYFAVTMPTAGTTINTLGISGARTWSADGAVLGNYEALYYKLPHGTNGASVAANFYVMGFFGSAEYSVDHDWIMLAARGESTSVKLGTGPSLANGQTWVGADGYLGQTDGNKLLTVGDMFADYILSGLSFTAGASKTANPISAGSAYVYGLKVTKTATTKTFVGNRDYYVDLSNAGLYTYPSVVNGDPPPAVTANSLRLEKVVTDANNVVSVTFLAPIKPFTVDASGKALSSGVPLITETVARQFAYFGMN